MIAVDDVKKYNWKQKEILSKIAQDNTKKTAEEVEKALKMLQCKQITTN